MAKEKQTSVKAITPKGVLIYPWLTKPDTKFNPDGEYRTTIAIYKDDAQEFCDKLDAILETSYKEAVDAAKTPIDKKKIKKSDPYVPQYDDDGNETGNILFKTKMKAVIKGKDGSMYTQKPKLFDAKGNPIPSSVNPYGGTVAKVAVEIAPYLMPATKECGLSLRLKAVQIIKLEEGSGGGNASSFGFGKEDGYGAADEVDTPFSTEEEDF